MGSGSLRGSIFALTASAIGSGTDLVIDNIAYRSAYTAECVHEQWLVLWNTAHPNGRYWVLLESVHARVESQASQSL